jgi:hypothetical protein
MKNSCLLGCDTVCLVGKDDSEERIASIISVTRIGELGAPVEATAISANVLS